MGPVSQNYLMTKGTICSKTKICHKIYLSCFTKLSYLMIIIRLFEILGHPNTCLKTILIMAAAYFFFIKKAISFIGNVSSGIG